MSDTVEATATALRGGELAVVPTDTVYGLAATAYGADPVSRLYALKGRRPEQATALVAASVDLLLECVPELRGRVGRALRDVLPGPFTLVVPNPSHRFPWLCGDRPEAIGVRVPGVTGVGRDLLARVGALAITSANLPGGPDPRSLGAVPAGLVDAVAAVLDGGELPGVPSTVVDLTGQEPRVLREGVVPTGDTLSRLSGT